jgi:sugar (pentulose or hexulose) kinase
MEAVIGIDLGTQGARAIAVARDGALLGTAKRDLETSAGPLPPGWHEQDPESWWPPVAECLQDLIKSLGPGARIAGVSVASTSGTLVPVGHKGKPLHPAIMYNDSRSAEVVAQVRKAGAELESRLGYAFASSFALPKIFWLARRQPAVFQSTVYFVHAADFIVGHLTGNFGISDYSNALKTGYDLIGLDWPAFIESDLGIPKAKLPRVIAPGELMGGISREGARQTGLAEGTPVLAGATDGTAAQIASGAAQPGQWNSALGTTLVLKGISERILLDPEGRIYCHRHPQGWWMPGGASNTGAEWIAKEHAGADPGELDAKAESLLPTRLVRYPLARKGERFPFVYPQAQGFCIGEGQDVMQAYGAGLEGVALLERLAYETLEGIGALIQDEVYATGGASRSAVWLRIRASTLNRVILRPRIAETAMGAAVLAACGVWFNGLSQAVQAMVHPGLVVQPDPSLHEALSRKYSMFLQELRARGYLA